MMRFLSTHASTEVVKIHEGGFPYNGTVELYNIPKPDIKDDYGASLLEYANGNKKWDAVVSDTVAEWASEKEATAE